MWKDLLMQWPYCEMRWWAMRRFKTEIDQVFYPTLLVKPVGKPWYKLHVTVKNDLGCWSRRVNTVNWYQGISALEICLRNIFVLVRYPRNIFPGTKLQITEEGGRKLSDRLLNLEACVNRINSRNTKLEKRHSTTDIGAGYLLHKRQHNTRW